VSYSLDVNILLYASDQSSPRHTEAINFLDCRVNDPDLLCLTWITLISYLRIATHPSIFSRPLSPSQALLNVEALLGLPRVRVLTEQTGFFEVYKEIACSCTVRGNLVPDAHLAALLRQHGVKILYTSDSDFRKFTFLDVKDPFQ
jgi:uncharacterized protein